MRFCRVAVLSLVGCWSAADDLPDDVPWPEPVPQDPDWPPDVMLPAEFDFPPYLTLPASTTVIVNWRTVNLSTGRVRFGTSEAYGTEIASPTAAHLHQIALDSLTPATEYHYEVVVDGTIASRRGVFVTPGRTQWRFLASGEFHAPSESGDVAGFAREMRSFRPHVIVESGDMADDGNDLTHWRSYLRTAAPWISNVLLLPAHSNHVNGIGGNANLKDLFVLPNNERWFVTRYGQVEFLTLDSTYAANEDVSSAQVPWLAAETALAHDGDDDPTFVVAAWHHSACSSFYSSRETERNWVHSQLVTTLSANGGVDLLFTGHDKYYERSTIAGGIVHVMTNIGKLSPSGPGLNHPDCAPQHASLTTRSTALVTVDGNLLSARVVDARGAELDSFAIQK